MSSQTQDEDRSEQATPFKLKEARDRGQVAKSAELGSVAVILAFGTLLFASGRALFERQLRLDAALLAQAHRLSFSETSVMGWLSAALTDTLWLLAPVFGLLILVGVLAGVVQTGPVFSFEPLKPDLDRVNPAAGMRRLFTMRLVFEAAKGLVKLALVGYTLFSVIEGMMPMLLGLSQAAPADYPRIGLTSAAALVLKVGVVMAAIALFDAVHVRWEHGRRMMMSRRELKEEVKRREGDPKIRARIRELQREMRKRSSALQRVADADVLITNPQHLAVALEYERQKMPAPQVIAKGAGDLAQRMKALARRHGVPIVENRPLARALFLRGELDAPIPQERYAETARVLAWVYALRGMRSGTPA